MAAVNADGEQEGERCQPLWCANPVASVMGYAQPALVEPKSYRFGEPRFCSPPSTGSGPVMLTTFTPPY
ncbi:hypothetical protein GOP47_0028109 [Adiantum capillus-veneris]|nr:hypothetical protein GOP47_0028109 [Adiantum capillus-veneris]